jgi:MucR family transcriptional regulator, transcriptional regulator of exopolysaccharide biosynthesis
MDDDSKPQDVLALTTEIVASFVGHNAVATSDLPTLIASVFQALSAVGQAEPEKAVEAPTPAVPIKKSVQQGFIICLEDGKKLKMLKRHLATRYSMTPEEYRRRWGLARDYPMVAPAYAAQRSALAREIGLGRKPAAPVAAEPARTKAAPPRRIGGRRKAST